MKKISILLLVFSMFARVVAAAENANDLFQQALAKERTEGNLQDAIKLYQRIVDKYAANRKVAAQALLQLAECQTRLGDAQSRKSLERVVRDFADQTETVAEARRRLAALGGGGSVGQQATRAVWTGHKVDPESSMSPDGRFISFPDWDTGNLALHDLVTGTDRLLTKTGSWKHGETAFAELSAISRDGKRVAYGWYDDKLGGRFELRVVDTNEDPKPRRLFEDAKFGYLEPCDWSPDGKWIAVALWSPDVLNRRIEQIGLIGAQDGSLRLLKSGTDNLRLGGFSSDGKFIVYTRGTAGASRGFIVSTDASSEVPLIAGTSSVESPVWTPDGSRIVFVSDRSGSPGLWAIRVADGKPLGEPELLKADFSYGQTTTTSTQAMGFARDGALFYKVHLDQHDIYVAGLDPSTGKLTSEPRRVNERGIGNSGGLIAWLPDGKSLSFWNGGRIDALVVHALASGEEREIWGGKSGRKTASYDGWFADGRSVMSQKRNGQTMVYSRVDSITGETQASWTVPDFPPGRAVAFSPDLMTAYFSQKDDKGQCEGTRCTYVMLAHELTTGRDREVFRIGLTNLMDASISQDGREIAFTAWDGPAFVVMVAPAAGGTPREIYRVADDAISLHTHTAWAPDGSHVLAFRFMPKGGELWSFPTKGGSLEKSPLRVRPIREPVVSPDGTQVAFAGGHSESEMWVMTGLFNNEKAAR